MKIVIAFALGICNDLIGDRQLRVPNGTGIMQNGLHRAFSEMPNGIYLSLFKNIQAPLKRLRPDMKFKFIEWDVHGYFLKVESHIPSILPSYFVQGCSNLTK